MITRFVITDVHKHHMHRAACPVQRHLVLVERTRIRGCRKAMPAFLYLATWGRPSLSFEDQVSTLGSKELTHKKTFFKPITLMQFKTLMSEIVCKG